jgi:tetratricopeptide (TPR) repeat protein
MSGPRLLAREREELDAVATPLRERRRVVAFLVGAAALRDPALSYLREASGVPVPEPVPLVEASQTLDALTEAAGRPRDEVRSFALDHGVTEVLRTLNWHREKLRRGAAVLVWIDGIEGLRALRALAPDAYSFRDVTVIVRGEETVAVVPPDQERPDLALHRRRHRKARTSKERAEAAVELAEALRGYGSFEEMRKIAEDALANFPAGTHLADDARITRAGLYLELAGDARGERVRAWRCANAGLAELGESASPESRIRRLLLLSQMPSPLGVDHRSVVQALAEIQALEYLPSHRCFVLESAAVDLIARRDVRRSTALLRDALSIPGLSPHNRSVIICELGYVSVVAGHLSTAEERYRESAQLAEQAGSGTSEAASRLAECLVVKGEHEAARRVLEGLRTDVRHGADASFYAGLELSKLRVKQGDVAPGLAYLRALIHDAAAASRDGHLYDACESYVACLRDAYDATRLSPTDLDDADAELDVAETVALSIAAADPPWYTILFPGLRAELLALRPERPNQGARSWIKPRAREHLGGFPLTPCPFPPQRGKGGPNLRAIDEIRALRRPARDHFRAQSRGIPSGPRHGVVSPRGAGQGPPFPRRGGKGTGVRGKPSRSSRAAARPRIALADSAEAIQLATIALDRARASWADAVPMHARMLAGHLVHAGRCDEARAVLDLAIPEAEAERHLRELARLRVLAVAVLARTGAPADAAMTSLRATLDETDAPRIVAEALLELALLLPPETARPDPLDLLDEAHALFVDMPIPGQEARCLDAMGDVLAALGDAAGARRRYLAAQGTYERYGLGLRLPLLAARLARLG